MMCEYQDGSTGIGSNMMPDAPVGGGSDRDKDGVPDATDNCPDLANADQSNVDGDATGDVCDVCPQIKDTGADTDKDGIGDACDPNPALKDSLWLFSAFQTLPTWSKSAGWALGTGGIVATSAGNSQSDYQSLTTQFTPVTTPLDKFAITTVVKVTAESGSQGNHDAGFDLYDSSNSRTVDCALEHSPVNANALLYLEEYNASGQVGNLSKTANYGWVQNMDYRLTMTRQGTTYTCTVVGPDGTMGTLTGTTSNVVPRDGTAAALWAFGATAVFHSVAIIGAHP